MPSPRRNSGGTVSGLAPLSYLNTNQPNTPLFLTATRSPTTRDKNFPVSTIWIDTSLPVIFILAGVRNNSAEWVTLGSAAGSFPITPYVVGPAGLAPYQTIQSAIDAANDAGGGFIFCQNDTYTENLILGPDISISGPQILSGYPGDPDSFIIVGNHTPPSTGAITFNNVTMDTPTGDTFFSTDPGAAELNFSNAGCGVTDGYFLNVPNWTGIISFWDFNPGSGVNDGGINNPNGNAPVYCYEAGVGFGTTNTMQVSGEMIFNQGEIMCPLELNTGARCSFANSIFGGTITTSGDSTFLSHHAYHDTGTTPAITHNSTGTFESFNAVVTSTNATPIGGTGAGQMTLGNTTFTDERAIAGTLTLTNDTSVHVGGLLSGDSLEVTADAGTGEAGALTLTNDGNETLGAGVGTVLMTGAGAQNSSGWLKIYVDGNERYIPYWTDIT